MPQYQFYFDTVEGEKKYNVDLGEDEIVEDVLRDILVELSEKGHVLRGLSTGDLKVIWGGRQGKELDMSRTLPEQGVQPNDVLRVLVEIYEGGSGLREQRIEREWVLVRKLADLNPEKLEVVSRTSVPTEEVFSIRLHDSPALERVSGNETIIRKTTSLRFCYSRFFPDCPIECYVEEPVFHPNVKAETGFMCLWSEANPRQGIVQAVARAQAIMAFRIVNLSEPHVMNSQAAGWYRSVDEGAEIPLSWDELQVFEVRDRLLAWLDPSRERRAHTLRGSGGNRCH